MAAASVRARNRAGSAHGPGPLRRSGRIAGARPGADGCNRAGSIPAGAAFSTEKTKTRKENRMDVIKEAVRSAAALFAFAAVCAVAYAASHAKGGEPWI